MRHSLFSRKGRQWKSRLENKGERMVECWNGLTMLEKNRRANQHVGGTSQEVGACRACSPHIPPSLFPQTAFRLQPLCPCPGTCGAEVQRNPKCCFFPHLQPKQINVSTCQPPVTLLAQASIYSNRLGVWRKERNTSLLRLQPL